jgi:FeS assembly protein IscX
MPPTKRTWQDVDELGRDLAEHHPDVDPLEQDLASLRSLVVALPTFGDAPDAADEETLEAIQASWYDAMED